jgi:hypothetical protein
MTLRGGVRYGASFPDAIIVPWPLGRMEIKKDSIAVAIPWLTFHFPRQSIGRLLKVPAFLSIGVQIEHRILEEPNCIVFWSYQFAEVKQQLQENGYSIS